MAHQKRITSNFLGSGHSEAVEMISPQKFMEKSSFLFCKIFHFCGLERFSIVIPAHTHTHMCPT